MYLKSLERVLIEGRNKNYGLNLFRPNFGQHVETVHLGHLNIKEDQLRREVFEGLDSFSSVSAFTNNFDLRIFLEQQTKIAPGQGLVINNHSSYSLSHDDSAQFLIAASSYETGPP